MSNIKELNIEEFSAPAYLTYAIKTVLDRAIPDVEDGMKPVQRRILYAMQELRLNNNAKPVKSARVVGNVIGMYHPHGDFSVYEAMVRMSQPWVMRYPLIEGEGNFGSRDGDPAAAMRYTEARLMPIAAALLEELDSDTVDFQPNYDNSRMEPQLLPARLPFMLLNGALGIAVGMQTLTVSHNLREVVEACKLIINKKGTTLDDILSVMPGPDFATGAQLISSADEIKKVYQDGRGPLRIRGCWTIERMGKNNKDWQMVITQLPPEVSTKDIMEQIEELVNPTQKEKGGKKQPLTAEQVRLKKMFSDMIEEVVDGRDLENPLNIIITPKNRSVDPEVLSSALCSYTDLEKNVNMNMVLVDLEGNPHRGGLLDWMNEWCIQRVRTFRRRIIFEKKKIDHRLHIIAGRLSILDRIEEVIRVLKKSKQPKEDLMSNFGLDEIQAEDVLEMRLRQLAGLEKDKLLAEQAEKIKEQTRLAKLLADEKLLRKEIIKELDQDAKAFGDDRRTLIEESRSATSRKDFVAQSASVGPEPIAIALTERGWISWKSVKTKEEALSAEFKMKTGDAVKRVYFGDRADNLVLVSQTGRAYSIPLRSSELDGKGDTLPLTQFFNFDGNDKIVEGAIAGNDEKFLVSTSAGFGFITSSNTWINRMKAGKEFMSLTEGATPLPPIPLKEFKDYEQSKVVVLSSDGRSVAFDFSELKEFPKSKGFALMGLDQDQEMVDITLHTTENPAKFINKKGKEVSFKDEEINEIYGKRSSSKKGKVLHKDLKGSLFERLGRDKSNPIVE